jgi:hypothetical protein
MKEKNKLTVGNILVMIFIAPFIALAAYCISVVVIIIYPILWVLIKLGIINEDCKMIPNEIWKHDV